jgi:phage terminase small subunit
MRSPTQKQRRFIVAYLKNGGNATQAALEAYDTTYGTARVIGCENLTKPNIRREFDRLMRAVKLSPMDGAIAIREGMDATDKNDRPDHRTRLKATEMYLKLIGAYPQGRQTRQRQANQQMDERRRWKEIIASDILALKKKS